MRILNIKCWLESLPSLFTKMDDTQSTLTPQDSISQVMPPDLDDEILDGHIISPSISSANNELPQPPSLCIRAPRGSFIKVLALGEGLEKAKLLVANVLHFQ
jgi:hypothetical protein